MKYTKEIITELKPNQVFVFGSNQAGIHGAGAALTAMQKFGAVYGQGEGMAGQSYAIPTKNHNIRTLPIGRISQHVQSFIQYAKANPDLEFLVTKIGCGFAGYTVKDIAPLFSGAATISNIILPQEFTNGNN